MLNKRISESCFIKFIISDMKEENLFLVVTDNKKREVLILGLEEVVKDLTNIYDTSFLYGNSHGISIRNMEVDGVRMEILEKVLSQFTEEMCLLRFSQETTPFILYTFFILLLIFIFLFLQFYICKGNLFSKKNV